VCPTERQVGIPQDGPCLMEYVVGGEAATHPADTTDAPRPPQIQTLLLLRQVAGSVVLVNAIPSASLTDRATKFSGTGRALVG
jgi:hypothetical protein